MKIKQKLPLCLYCKINYVKSKKNKYCSVACGAKSSKTVEKRNKTNLEKFGVKNPFQSKIIIEKIKKTNLERYGSEYIRNSPLIDEKIKKTNLERYGSISPFGSIDVLKKTINTNLQKYGVKSNLQRDDIRTKIKKTMKEKYGKEHNFSSIPEKILKVLSAKEEMEYLYYENNKSIKEISKELNVSYKTVLDSLNNLGIKLRNTNNGISYFENEIKDFIESLGGVSFKK